MDLDNARVGHVLSKIAAVEDRHRRFIIDAETAQKHHGIAPDVLERLVKDGLPQRVDEGMARFDPFDLSNVSLHLNLASIQRLAMRTWARTFRLADQADPMEAHILVQPVDGKGSPGTGTTIRTQLTEPPLRAPAHIRPLLDEVAGHEFYMLPESCRWDTSFIRQHRMCECGGASKDLMERAHGRDIEARQCFGLLIAEPYSTGHYWTEIRIDQEWWAFDPLLIKLLGHATKFDGASWPLDRSTRAVLHRLCVIRDYSPAGAPLLDGFRDEPHMANPVVVMQDQAMVVSLPTRFVSAAPASSSAAAANVQHQPAREAGLPIRER